MSTNEFLSTFREAAPSDLLSIFCRHLEEYRER
jgi:hypothetical protein